MAPSESDDKPKVVGLYGVPGVGKTFLLQQLRKELGETRFTFLEGSEVIANLVTGGLEGFQRVPESEKNYWRDVAIKGIGKCIRSGTAAVVTGHFMFWPEDQEVGNTVYTQRDLQTYTHIIYLDIPAEIIAEQRSQDGNKVRPTVTISHLQKWQEAEKTQLRDLCRRHGILLSVVSSYPKLLRQVSTLLCDFVRHNEKHNLDSAEYRLLGHLFKERKKLESVLLIDADRTLCKVDTGTLFWQRFFSKSNMKMKDGPLKKLFSGPLAYSYTAFRQATMLYEEMAEDEEFEALCEDVALEVTMYPEFVSLLQMIQEQEHIGAVVVTCGLRRIWEIVLAKERLFEKVKVIGGGRISDGLVVTGEVKGALVDRLRKIGSLSVWAFGDSPLDLDMLRKAHKAIVVVGDESTRSKSMDRALLEAIENDGLQACQAVLPNGASPRLDTTKLPLIRLTDPELINPLFRGGRQQFDTKIVHATDRTAAKLLMTPMRNANIAGPVLREAHRRAGWYVATEFLPELVGVEEYHIPHVQGYQTAGHRLFHEKQTLIVPLMRGGEPMAFGVNDAFPLAMFLHANDPDDINLHHLEGQITVVLVDSVVNSGKTVIEFVEHIRKLHTTIRIVVVAGVVQAGFIAEGSLNRYHSLSLAALRISDNKFTGGGETDTGNRLFNTTHLP
jgi:uracil phosphoribosyltransferase/phosphoserine phosphatase